MYIFKHTQLHACSDAFSMPTDDERTKKLLHKNAISKFFYARWILSTVCGIISLWVFSFFLFISLHFNCNELGVDKVTRSLTSFWWYAFFAGAASNRVQFYVRQNLICCVVVCFFAISKLLFPQGNAHTHRSTGFVWLISLGCRRYLFDNLHSMNSRMSSSVVRRHQSHANTTPASQIGSGQLWPQRQRALIKFDVKTSEMHKHQKQIFEFFFFFVRTF